MTTHPSPTPETTYDAVPYSNQTFWQTHPDRLATVATLCGLAPPAPERSRVLEIGSGRGGNLLGIAASMPGASCLGIDLSRRQQEEAVELARAAGIGNAEFRQMSFADLGDEIGSFDYVIAQGVYSWVDRDLQEALLDLVARHLSPTGVAYVSYNIFPGWRARGMLREMMQHHVRSISDPIQRVHQSRALLDFLADHAPRDNSYRALLREERELIRPVADAYLFHDHLEEENNPLYFHEMVERIGLHGLRYLGEADFPTMFPNDLSVEARQTLLQVAPDQLQLEQYMDFLRHRAYRQSLLVHEAQAPSYDVSPERLRGLRVASPARPTGPVDMAEGVEVAFEGTGEQRLSTGSPIFKMALLVLSERWPASIPFDDLCVEVRRRLEPGGKITEEVAAGDRAALGQALLSVYVTAFTTMVSLRVRDPDVAFVVSERPRSASFGRFQATRGFPVTNLFSQSVDLGDLDAHLLQLADGTRDRDGLAESLTERAVDGVITLRQEGEPVHDPKLLREAFEKMVDERLPDLVRASLMAG